MAPAQIFAVAFIVIANVWALTSTAAASASGSLDGVRGILVLAVFTAEGLVLYRNQHLFRDMPK
jgi:hypothetical protein